MKRIRVSGFCEKWRIRVSVSFRYRYTYPYPCYLGIKHSYQILPREEKTMWPQRSFLGNYTITVSHTDNLSLVWQATEMDTQKQSISLILLYHVQFGRSHFRKHLLVTEERPRSICRAPAPLEHLYDLAPITRLHLDAPEPNDPDQLPIIFLCFWPFSIG